MINFADHNITAYFSSRRVCLASFKAKKFPRLTLDNYISGSLDGLIKDKYVINTDKTAALLRTMLDKMKAGKKRVNVIDLCLPDSYFFSRAIKIPNSKWSNDNIPEYVHKKAEELFPSSIAELRVRWQVMQQEKEIILLIVGIDKKTVDPLVDLFGQNSYFVRQIKPMSFLLGDLIGKFGTADCLIQSYCDGELTTAVLYQKTVLFAACLTAFSKEEITPDLLQAEADKARQFILTLKTSIKLNTVWLVGFKPEEQVPAAKYHPTETNPILLDEKIIITSRYKTPITPALTALAAFTQADLQSMNFVAVQNQKKLQQVLFFHRLFKSLYIFCLALLIPLAVLGFFGLKAFYNLKTEKMVLESAKNSRITAQAREIEQGTIRINQKTQALTTLFGQKSQSYSMLLSVYEAIPTGVKISSLAYSVDKKIIVLKGTAFSRSDLLTFENNIQKLGTVNLPITSFVKQKDLTFEATINLKP